ncbi:pantetheine-phosphate adenylyltransferase [Natrarchaeobius halalkaliphilus]|uniref:Phosphopantetheine adenylyltransferase n=1 Tax=Natrarchaeobius halalkaliphilus TaxID=1679091 RepID=A0A3N6M5P2_9EURY|nr:pantetheine-phosphate adenylyltransferase [Natrarchaeobius halalkaliphilus]RQG88079.1 pantetheine-phosphate adenylyltransferase [Natrarchaeobius halalkaliphilus]
MNSGKRIAILGGTFTPVHDGHRALLHKTFQTASHDGSGDGHVIVALTSTPLARRTRSDPTHSELLGPFEQRCDSLETEIEQLSDAYTASFEIIKLEDTHGPAVSREDIDVLVVSPEGKAQHRAHNINEQRVSNGLSPIEIHTAPFVIADDGVRISSTRIRNGEIDAHGRLLEESE